MTAAFGRLFLLLRGTALCYRWYRRTHPTQIGKFPSTAVGGRGRVYGTGSRFVTPDSQMKKLSTWLIEAEVAVVHIYALWHLVKALFFHGCL
jgi:hypothetical protein